MQVNHVEMIAPDCARGMARSGHLYGDLKNDQQPDLTYPGSRVSQNCLAMADLGAKSYRVRTTNYEFSDCVITELVIAIFSS